ncbi:MAG TPA: glycoside hydrolase family 9 protein [Coleofasciculaceae cyanobacterium]|jgi:endoglucanase
MLENLAIPPLFPKAVSKRLAIALAGSMLLFSALTSEAMTFRVSSIGYHTQGGKIAVLEDVPEGQDVQVVLFDTTRRNPRLPVFLGATVYKFENPGVFEDKNQAGPPAKNLVLDFSNFKEPGTYEFRIEGTDIKSQPIRISDFLYWDLLKPVVKTFYFQRSGQEIEDRGLSLYHPAAHVQDADAEIADKPREESLDVAGGWYNGGDYAKYATSTALAAAKLMAMSDWNLKSFKYFRLEYPLGEPGYGTTDDLHHEIMAGLDWLMAMQRADGAVYRKVSGKQWPGKVTPEEDEQKRYVYGVTTQDTANAAAAFGMAARSFKTADLGYSIKSLRAAEKAWTFLEAHPEMIRPEPDFTGSGEFLDVHAKNDIPYRVWAAAELYIATGKEKYHRYFLSHLKDVPLQRFSWQNPAMQGITDYLFYATSPDPQATAALKGGILNMADLIIREIDADHWTAGLRAYPKSSNQEITERAAILLTAARLSGKTTYREAANRSIGTIFGINPLGMTFITGMAKEGVKAVEHPSHRWMEATGKLIPGYLVDGPNETATDGKTPKGFGPMSYTDNAAATAVNESTILNNASLAFVLGVLNDTYNVNKEISDTPKDPTGPLDFQLAPERPTSAKAKKARVTH